MFTKLFTSLILVTGACATTSAIPTLPSEHTMARSIVIDPAHAESDAAQPWFPALATEAALPSAQAMRTELISTGHERFAIGVRVCVSPTGAVSRVDLAETSGITELDQAALRDIAQWRYQQFAGPVQLSTCKPLTLRYTP